MLIYAKGNSIPEDIREREPRFIYKGKSSATALKKYWRLLPNGEIDPGCKPFNSRGEIELLHRAYPELGAFRIEARRVGRPLSDSGNGEGRERTEKRRTDEDEPKY